MKLETAEQVWGLEAVAHDYAGFIVVEKDTGYDRVFLQDKREVVPALNSMKKHGNIVIKVVLV